MLAGKSVDVVTQHTGIFTDNIWSSAGFHGHLILVKSVTKSLRPNRQRPRASFNKNVKTKGDLARPETFVVWTKFLLVAPKFCVHQCKLEPRELGQVYAQNKATTAFVRKWYFIPRTLIDKPAGKQCKL